MCGGRQIAREAQRKRTYRQRCGCDYGGRDGRPEGIAQQAVEHRRDRARPDGSRIEESEGAFSAAGRRELGHLLRLSPLHIRTLDAQTLGFNHVVLEDLDGSERPSSPTSGLPRDCSVSVEESSQFASALLLSERVETGHRAQDKSEGDRNPHRFP